MTPPYDTDAVDPTTVAEYILWLRQQQDLLTTPLHIVKLVYLCHGWMLGLHKYPLINEAVVVGRFGPVVQSVYDRYKRFGSGPIFGVKTADRSDRLTRDQVVIVQAVETAYADFEDTRLSAITHLQGTPWSIANASKGVGAEIPDESIQRHYAELSNREPNADAV